ncbi:cysteine sulfinic acid decarboxylase [Biomphalaria pfeifferi]|uniref:Cysteine sulfinic acid decarboxylase n=1 Tax=Biomphalaria pfeifferi TaxID=112525 RepID=A0AAD8C839_BIOPF|nr:cysteine sulfinic acid decarboxylase [Biomphalaria pfeifferi]
MSVEGRTFTDLDVEGFLGAVHKLITEEAFVKGTNRGNPVFEFKQPEDLKTLIDFEIKANPSTHAAILEELTKIIKYSVKTGHPYFFNLLFSGLDPYSQAGSWVTDAVNSNMHTYETSPVFILMENYMFKKLTSIVGFDDGGGLFCPGGSASNQLALHIARFNRFPEIKKVGLYGLPRLRCYISEDGHYSLKKAGNYLGIGEENVVTILTDNSGRVLPGDLQQKVVADIEQGYIPLFVMATCGSTVLGSFDSLPELQDICRRYNMWLHCDACYGGSVLLSKQHRHLLYGIERCDSVSWNFHKMSGLPHQCAALLVKNKAILLEANCSKAEYLFQADKFYDTNYDIGDKSIQCGRKVDVLKLWTLWKAIGDLGMENRINKAFEKARYMVDLLKKSPGFRPVLPEFQCVSVSFWYIPERYRGQEETPEWWLAIHKVAPEIKRRMVEAGTLMISYQPMSSKGFVNFFRIVLHNPACNQGDMKYVIEEIDRLGKDL